MTHYDYEISKQIAAKDYPFYALIMAAMRKADSNNIELLKSIYPHTHAEFEKRYHAPGGMIDGDN